MMMTIMTTISLIMYFMLALTMIVALVKKQVPEIIIDILVVLSITNLCIWGFGDE
jgi:hypothetical protein